VAFITEVVAQGAGTPFVHAPTIAVLPSGEMLVAWYGASHMRGRDAAVYGARSSDGGRHWSAPAAWADTPGFPEANPVLFRDPQGRLWLFYSTRLVGWAVAWLRHRQSTDGGATWGPSTFLTWVPGYLPRAKPIILADASWVLPVYHEEWGSRFLRSVDQGLSWAWSKTVVSDPLNIQPAVVEVAPGRLLALMRNRGRMGRAWMATSADGGQTWDQPTLTEVRNPDAALDLVRLRDGTLALVYNDSSRNRHALAVALSPDGGRTWPTQTLLEGCAAVAEEMGSYPALAEGPDGALHVVYAYGGSRSIRYVRLDPRRIAAAGHTPGRCDGPHLSVR
jgi:predicted neuraminidase